MKLEADKKWNELSPALKERMVTILKKQLGEGFFEGVRQAYRKNPDTWWAEGMWHFGQGMGIRNMLREYGIRDSETPDGNLDDYYTQAVEVAAGIREM